MGVAMSYPADMSLFLIYSLAHRFFLPCSSLMALPWTSPEGKCIDKESPFSAISQYFRGSLSPHFQWQLLLSQPQGAPLAASSSPCPVLLLHLDRFSFSQLAAKATVAYLELSSLANGSISFMESPLSKFTRQLSFGYHSSRHFASTNSNTQSSRNSGICLPILPTNASAYYLTA